MHYLVRSKKSANETVKSNNTMLLVLFFQNDGPPMVCPCPIHYGRSMDKPIYATG